MEGQSLRCPEARRRRGWRRSDASSPRRPRNGYDIVFTPLRISARFPAGANGGTDGIDSSWRASYCLDKLDQTPWLGGDRAMVGTVQIGRFARGGGGSEAELQRSP